MIFLLLFTGTFTISSKADSSSPALAAYYDLFMAICGDMTYEWYEDENPRPGMSKIKQVGVGKNNRYALTSRNKLVFWKQNPGKVVELMDNVQSFSAGKTGIFAIRNDNSLWKFNVSSLLGLGENVSDKPDHIADNVQSASIGDSANYYVTADGALMVRGLAHRGQYGDGKLTQHDRFIQTSSNVRQVVSHTGHALLLKTNGEVWGTGGNIYGPLGHHGLGDKAISWGLIMENVSEIATGSSHTLAIDVNRDLWTWGRGEGLEPKKIMAKVDAVAAGYSSSIALSQNRLWQWDRGDRPRKIMECD